MTQTTHHEVRDHHGCQHDRTNPVLIRPRPCVLLDPRETKSLNDNQTTISPRQREDED